MQWLERPVFLTEAEQRRELRRHQRLATGCLIGAALLYGISHWLDHDSYWLHLVRAAAEAGLIGGIADWFAVVALFRRPLGLPIPHTGILPRNKERLGRGLGRFVSRHFLDPAVVEQRMQTSSPALHVGHWLADRDRADALAERLLTLLPDVIGAFDDDEVKGFYRELFADQVRRLDLQPLVQRLALLLIERQQHQRLFDRGLRWAAILLDQHRERIYERVEARSSWWIPKRIDRKLAEAIVQGVEDWLADLSEPTHAIRKEFDQAIDRYARGLGDSEEVAARLQRLRDQALASDEVRQLVDRLWSDLRQRAVARLDTGTSPASEPLGRALQQFGETLLEDPAARRRIDQRIGLLLQETILPFREQIGQFIADVVRDWDSEGLASRLELTVGKDLQYIRINGTLVGALVGVVLFVLTDAVF